MEPLLLMSCTVGLLRVFSHALLSRAPKKFLISVMAALATTALSVNAIVRRMGEIEVLLSTLQQLDSIVDRHSAYHRLAEELNESIVPSCQKYKIKAESNTKDAVTEQLRYGPETRKKIDAMFVKVDEIMKIVTERELELSTIYLAEVEKNGKRKLLEQQQLVDSYREKAVAVTSLNAGEAFQMVKETPAPITGLLAAEDEEARLLRDEADKVRSFREKMKLELEGLVAGMNSREPPNVTLTLKECLKQVDESMGDKKQIKTLLLTVSKLLGDIQRYPDNAKLRRVNFCNSDIWSKVTGHDKGVQLLLLIGFSAKLEHNKDKEIVFPSSSDEATLTVSSRIRGLLGGTGSDLFLEMHEPDPEASDITPWIEWFDKLKENEQIIAQHATTS